MHDRRRVSYLFLLVLLGAIGIIVTVPLTSRTTEESTTTEAPTYPPCDSNSGFLTGNASKGTWGYIGQLFDYYPAEDSFVYAVVYPTTSVLESRQKSTGLINWNVTLCNSNSNLNYYSQLSINRTNGDIFIMHMCFSRQTYLSRYSANGQLVWSNNITVPAPELSATRTLDLESPITFNHADQVLYVNIEGYSTNLLCAFGTVNGSKIWCVSSTTAVSLAGVEYSEFNHFIYVISYDSSESVKWFDRAGSFVGSSTVPQANNFFPSTMRIDPTNGDLYFAENFFINSTNRPAVVTKLDASFVQQWQTNIFPTENVNAFSNTYGSTLLAFDAINELIIVSGDFYRYANSTQTLLFFATINSQTGDLVSYNETVALSPNFVSVSSHSESRSFFYAYMEYAVGWSLKTFCY